MDDLERAKAWYANVLGLPHLYTFGRLSFFDCAGTRLMLEDRDSEGGFLAIMAQVRPAAT